MTVNPLTVPVVFVSILMLPTLVNVTPAAPVMPPWMFSTVLASAPMATAPLVSVIRPLTVLVLMPATWLVELYTASITPPVLMPVPLMR